MLQIACFKVPEEQDNANTFLRAHKPAGEISFNKDIIFIGYDDDPAKDLVELLESVGNAKFQQEVSLHILKAELADLKPKANKGAYEDKQAQIFAVLKAIDVQDTKAEFLRI